MIPGGFKCPRRVGFLFPHPCERASPIGCPDCNGGQIEDPYASRVDRGPYTDYDQYGADQSIFFTASRPGPLRFTEADGEKLVKPDRDFEDDNYGS